MAVIYIAIMFGTGKKKRLQATCLLLAAFVMLTSCSSSRRSSTGELPAASMQKKYASLLDVSPSKITNKSLYEFIDKWLGTKYQYGAQQNTGIDCSGFTQLLYDAVYKKKIARTSELQFDASKTNDSKNKLEEGDLVFFRTGSGKKISHVGVYLQNDRFVNATNKGVLISDMNLKYWSESFVAGGRP